MLLVMFFINCLYSSMALPSEGDMIRNKRYRTKDDIKKRLKDMNSQFNAIECLQKNIEDDFKASKLVCTGSSCVSC